MDNDFEVIKDPKIEEYKQQDLEAGYAFDELSRMKGWKYVTALIDNTIRVFTNKAILSGGFKTMEEYAFERGIVEGQRRILKEVEDKIKFVREENARGQTIN